MVMKYCIKFAWEEKELLLDYGDIWTITSNGKRENNRT
jgi:hypothetical protein